MWDTMRIQRDLTGPLVFSCNEMLWSCPRPYLWKIIRARWAIPYLYGQAESLPRNSNANEPMPQAVNSSVLCKNICTLVLGAMQNIRSSFLQDDVSSGRRILVAYFEGTSREWASHPCGRPLTTPASFRWWDLSSEEWQQLQHRKGKCAVLAISVDSYRFSSDGSRVSVFDCCRKLN